MKLWKLSTNYCTVFKLYFKKYLNVPDAEFSDEARLRLGDIAYLQGDNDSAEKYFNSINLNKTADKKNHIFMTTD